MNRAFHEAESIRYFSEPFTEVHKWLDELVWKDGKLNVFHRRFRHNMQGVRFITDKYGHLAGKAAIRHIITDLTSNLWNQKDGIPETPEDYDKIFGIGGI